VDEGIGIIGFGSFLPPRVRGNEHWDETRKREQDRWKQDFLAIERSTGGDKNDLPPEIADALAAFRHDPFLGARTRHVLDDDAEVSDMEAEAARRAIRSAGLSTADIDLVLVNSLVPDLLLPSNGPAVQAKCELVNASAWSLDVGCASFQPQLITAASLIRAGVHRHVLVVLSHAASRVIDYDKVSSSAFGDGAAAVVVSRVRGGQGLIGYYARTDGSLRDGIVFAPVIDGRPQRRWDRCTGPTRFSSFNVDLGKRAGMQSTAYCRDACHGALRDAGVELDQVSLFICNQSLGWLVDACRRGLGLPAEKAIDSFAEVGNLGAAAVPFNLERAWRAGRLKPGDLVLMYSPGAGLTRAAAVYRWIEPREGRPVD
jgi:3-oxoacyl-[acyl-carrier-protein] synthase-3